MKRIREKYVRAAAFVLVVAILSILCSACGVPHGQGEKPRHKSSIITTGSSAIRLKPDGTVGAIGKNCDFQNDVSEWRDIVTIAADDYHIVGLKSDGTVVAAGSELGGACNVSEWTDIVDIAAGTTFSIGLKSDGTVVIAADDEFSPRNEILAWTDIIAVYANAHQIAGLKSDGTVVTTSRVERAKMDVSEWTNIVDVSISPWHIVGLKSDGTVVAKAREEASGKECNVSGWKDIVAISAGQGGTIGLKSDGTLEGSGEIHGNIDENTIIIRTLSDYKDVADISFSGGYLMMLYKNGAISFYGDWMWRFDQTAMREEMKKLLN